VFHIKIKKPFLDTEACEVTNSTSNSINKVKCF
jgi:hypothetical protein